jgi:hypothetical protein
MNLNDDADVSQLRLRLSDLAEEPRRILPPIEGFDNMPLVPLEEAVEPLVKHVHDIKHQASISKKDCKQPPADGLTIDESAAIRLYTMTWSPYDQCLYFVLNKTLRDEDRNRLKVWFPYLKLIISSLRKIPSIPYRLFRGVKLDLSQEHPKGEETIWWAFSSCTNSMAVLEKPTFMGKTGIRTLFKIDCYSAKDIHQHSRYPTENEWVLLPATLFQIVESSDVGHGLHIIHLKEIEPKYPLLEKGPSVSINQVELMPFSIRNLHLEREIARFQPRSNVNLDGQQLTDRDMTTVVQQAIVDRRCVKLSLRNNQLTSQGILTLATGIRESITLEELNLGDNGLLDEDLFPLAQVLSVNRSAIVKQWRCCGMARVKVSRCYQIIEERNTEDDHVLA